MTNYILSAFIGLLLGYIYGLFFLFHIRRVLLVKAPSPSDKNITKASLISFTSAIARMVILAVIAWLLLRIPSINFVLVLLSFLVTFWLVILNYKAFWYARR